MAEKRRATTFRTSKGTVVNVQYPDIYISPAFLTNEDVTSQDEMRERLREDLKGITKRSGGGGLEYEIWFNKRDYTPHYAEHVIDPTDGKQKLVMADPHTQHKAFILDLETGEIEWEFTVPGSAVANPHTARMLMENVRDFGSAGDIYCVDRDQNIIVVDRTTKAVKFSRSVPWTATWVHDAILGVDKASLIVADYHAGPARGTVGKLSLPSLAAVWTRADIHKPGKVSIIEGAGLLHNPSFGGEYIVCENSWQEGVARKIGSMQELRDSDGVTMWRNPAADLTGTWITAPHSAFRMGTGEFRGSVTVVGSEGGGGIYAIDYQGRSNWGIPSNLVYWRATLPIAYYYSSGSRNICETTHVFPTLDGRIGFCAWSGVNSVIVGVITQLPLRQEVGLALAKDYISTDAWVFLDPPIRVEEWDENFIVVKNIGANSLDWRVDAYMIPEVNLNARPAESMVPLLPAAAVAAAGWASADYVHPYKWLRVAVRSTTPGSATTYDVYVNQRRK